MPQSVNAFEILARYYSPSERSHEVIVVHSVLVARLAHEIARTYLERHAAAELDLPFILEAALLHDIGIGASGPGWSSSVRRTGVADTDPPCREYRPGETRALRRPLPQAA